MCKWSWSSGDATGRLMARALCALALIALTSAACGRNSSPVAPSPTPGPAPPVAASFAVSGVVSGETDGSFVPGARVEVVDGTSAATTILTDEAGRYRLGDLPSGAYTLRASAADFQPSSSSFTLNADKTVDFVLVRSTDNPAPAPPEGWRIRGTVTEAATDRPLADVRVDVTDSTGGSRTATTDTMGGYILSNLQAGKVTLRAAVDGYAPKSTTVTLNADVTVDFRLEPAGAPGPQLNGRAIGVLSNQPLMGVTVRADGGGQTLTDDDGQFSLAGAGAPAGSQRLTFSSTSTVERQMPVRAPGDAASVTLIPKSFDLRSFDEMFRARGGLHRWVEAPRLVVERRVLTFTNTTAMNYTATADLMSEEEASQLIDDLSRALPQLTGNSFSGFASVDIEVADEGDPVAISRDGVIVVARYQGLSPKLGAWGYGRWAWNGAGQVRMGAVMVDNEFEQSGSPYRRSLRAHELGHALGYDHVSSDASAMNISGRIEPTAFDLDATSIAFRREPLNMSPDIDPDPATVQRRTSERTLTWGGER
jgi:hypothetical protein